MPPAQTPTAADLDAERLRKEREERLHGAVPTGYRRTPDGSLEPIPGGPVGSPDTAPATQLRDAGFYLRAGRANGLYEQHQVEPRGVVGQTLADAFPRLGNVTASPERQVAEAAQADFIGATLRYESGAAVPPAEFEMQRVRYFPQPGDSPEVIAFKATLRRNAIEALQRSAGPAAHNVDTSIPRDQMSPGGQMGAAVRDVGVTVAGGGMPPPSGPSDPTHVQPGETMAGVGTLPVGDPQSGDRLALTEGERFEVDPRAPQVAAQLTAALRRGGGRDELLRIIGQLGPVSMDQRAWIDAAIQPRNRNYWRTHNPIPPGFGRRPVQESPISSILPKDGAMTAGVAGALDSASLGVPALLSSGYRERMGTLREEHPVASTVGAVLGGVVAPGGPRAGMGLLQQTRRAAFQGGVYGFNESGGDPVAGITGAGIGAALPGAFNVAGRGLRAVPRAFRLGGNYADEEAQALAQSLTEEGIQGSRPLLDPSTRTRAAYLESQRGSGGPIRQSLAATRQGVEAGAERIGAGGTAEPAGVMGTRVQDALLRDHRQQGAAAGRIYDAADAMAAQEGAPGIRAVETVAQLDNTLTRLRRNAPANQPIIDYLESVRANFVDPEGNLLTKSIADIRDIRTSVSGAINHRNLARTRAEHYVTEALDAAKADVARDFGSTAPEALRLYNRADGMWAAWHANRREILDRLIGRDMENPLSGEQVMARLQTMAGNRGDVARLERMWQRLGSEEQLDTAATLAESAITRSPDEGFQLQNFVNWARTFSPEGRRVIFGPEASRSIGNLVRISKALQATEGSLNNSRSGVVQNWAGAFRDFVRGGTGGGVVGLVGGGSVLASGGLGAAVGGTVSLGGMALRRLSARSLMSPDLSRWLAAAPRATTPSAVRSHIDRLQVIARTQRNPAIAQEVLGLRQALMNAVNDNASVGMRAAADSGPAGADNRQEQ